MTTRNLTPRFVELRQANRANKQLGVVQGPGSTGADSVLLQAQQRDEQGSWAAMKNALPPAYVDTLDRVEADIRRAQELMRTLAQMHADRLRVTFDEDEAEKEARIERTTSEITQIFRSAEAQLKRAGEGGGLSGNEATVISNMQRSMARKLQQLSVAFRQSQKEYLARVKAQKSGASGGFEFLTEENKREIGALEDTGFTAQQMAILEMTERVVEERDQEIRAIAQSVVDLSQVTKELACLVYDQGTLLDRIDYALETTVEHTRSGIQQLEKAEEHQKNALPLKCIAVLVLLIIIMLAVLVSRVTSKNNDDD